VLDSHFTVITAQMAVAPKNDARELQLSSETYENLPPDLLAMRQRCHVYITDKEDEAKLLRK